VRIAGVFLRGHHRRRVAHKSFFFEPRGHLLLNRELRHRLAVARPLRDLLECAILDAIEGL
jgi:hypothetical protein